MTTKHITAIGGAALLSMASASFGSEVFIEASTELQKVGLVVGGFRPFIAGSYSFITYTEGDNRSGLTIGAGADIVKPYNEIELGIRALAFQSMSFPESYFSEQTGGSLHLIATKSFGPLSFGAGLGPSFISSPGPYEGDINVTSLGSELFCRFSF
jgi:hypothetical protein